MKTNSVLVLGDSHARRLGQHLSEMYGHNVQVLIEGVGGADTDEVTRLLRRHRFDLKDVRDKYKVCVIVAGGNNVYDKENWRQPGTVPRVTREKLLRLTRAALHVAQHVIVVALFPKALLKTDDEYQSVRRRTGVSMTRHTVIDFNRHVLRVNKSLREKLSAAPRATFVWYEDLRRLSLGHNGTGSHLIDCVHLSAPAYRHLARLLKPAVSAHL